MAITKEQARQLAALFRNLSVQLGDFRFDNWPALSPANRQTIQDAEWTLLNASSDMTTTAVGLALKSMEADLKAITNATTKAKKTIATIKKVKVIIEIAAAAVALAGAIASQNPGAIASAAANLYKEAKDGIA